MNDQQFQQHDHNNHYKAADPAIARIAASVVAEHGHNSVAAAAAPPFLSLKSPPLAVSQQQQQQQHTAESQNELQRLRGRARAAVDETICRIPLERKQAYLQAMEQVPNLVRTETDSLQFVRRCDYNTQAAAERLCHYWEERVRLFGSDRAFLPLNLTGEGALTPDDVNCLKSGYPALIPDTRSGQKVIFADRRKSLPTATPESRLRCGFYLHKCLAECDERTQTDGVLGLCLLVTPRVEPADLNLMVKIMDNASRCFPTKIHTHFLVMPPHARIGKRYAIQDIVTTLGGYALEECKDFASVHVHIEREHGQVLQELLDLGLVKEGIPYSVGGSWKYQAFFDWCNRQEQQERKEYARAALLDSAAAIALADCNSGARAGAAFVKADPTVTSRSRQIPWTISSAINNASPPAVASSVAAAAAAITTTTVVVQGQQSCASVAAPPFVLLSEDDRKMKKKLYDVLHSRRKREQEKEHVLNLKQEVSELEQQEKKLKAENEHLNGLLNQANKVLASLKPEDSY